jgi:hypothetical protein
MMNDCDRLHDTPPHGVERHRSATHASYPGHRWLSALLMSSAVEADSRK